MRCVHKVSTLKLYLPRLKYKMAETLIYFKIVPFVEAPLKLLFTVVLILMSTKSSNPTIETKVWFSKQEIVAQSYWAWLHSSVWAKTFAYRLHYHLKKTKKRWKVTVILVIVGALGTIPKRLKKRLGKLEMWGKNESVQTKTLLISARTLSRISVKATTLNWCENLQRVKQWELLYCNWILWNGTQQLRKETGGIRNKRKDRDYPNNNIVTNS